MMTSGEILVPGPLDPNVSVAGAESSMEDDKMTKIFSSVNDLRQRMDAYAARGSGTVAEMLGRGDADDEHLIEITRSATGDVKTFKIGSLYSAQRWIRQNAKPKDKWKIIDASGKVVESK